MKRLLIALAVAMLACSMLAAAEYATLEGTITGISKYGNAATDITSAPAEGYEPGDMVTITIGDYSAPAPLGTDSHIAVEVPGENTHNEWCEPVSDEVYSKLK